MMAIDRHPGVGKVLCSLGHRDKIIQIFMSIMYLGDGTGEEVITSLIFQSVVKIVVTIHFEVWHKAFKTSIIL